MLRVEKLDPVRELSGIDSYLIGVNTKLECNQYLDCYNCTLSNCIWQTERDRCSNIQLAGQDSTIIDNEADVGGLFNTTDLNNFDPSKDNHNDETRVQNFFI